MAKSLKTDEIVIIDDTDVFLNEEYVISSTLKKNYCQDGQFTTESESLPLAISQDHLKYYGSIIPNAEQESLNFDIPPLHEGESVSVVSKEKLQEFEARGIVVKTGKWSKKEEKKLKNNYDTLVAKYQINDPYFIFGIGHGHRSKESLMFLKRTHFYVQLGKSLSNRTLRSIYIKARDMFHPHKNNNHPNEEEVSYIFEKQKQLGNRWTKIGKNLKRTDTNCKEIYRWREKNIKKGRWSKEEVEMLKYAIERVAGTSNLSASQIENISWEKVAELVPFRNFSQCRHYWAEHLAWDCDVAQRVKFDQYCFAKLIFLLKKHYYVKNETEVDWRKLQELFKNASPSYVFLQKQFRYLKSRVQIQGVSDNFRELIDLLFKKYEESIEKLTFEC